MRLLAHTQVSYHIVLHVFMRFVAMLSSAGYSHRLPLSLFSGVSSLSFCLFLFLSFSLSLITLFVFGYISFSFSRTDFSFVFSFHFSSLPSPVPALPLTHPLHPPTYQSVAGSLSVVATRMIRVERDVRTTVRDLLIYVDPSVGDSGSGMFGSE